MKNASEKQITTLTAWLEHSLKEAQETYEFHRERSDTPVTGGEEHAGLMCHYDGRALAFRRVLGWLASRKLEVKP